MGSFLSWMRMDVIRLVSLKSSTTSDCVSTRLTTRSHGFSLSSSPSSCSRKICVKVNNNNNDNNNDEEPHVHTKAMASHLIVDKKKQRKSQ